MERSDLPPQFVIGLTGNIASGKSAAARWLGTLGADVVDADELAHDAMRPGTPETAAIRERFGAAVIGPDGAVDRVALGGIVFSDARALADLERIVHPAVRRQILERVAGSRARVVVIEAIKLLEGPLAQQVDAIWVVTAPHAVRIQRLIDQRGLPAEEAAQRVDAQNPEPEKVRRAAVVIVNEGSPAELRAAVEAAWGELMRALNLRQGTRTPS